jgi:uncharacterized protein (DUF2236 family)
VPVSERGGVPYAEFVTAAGYYYSGPKYYTNPADPAREDDGLFGPGSVTWRVVNSRVMWVAGFRSLYLQGLHPRVMRATWQNGSFTDPAEAWGRLFRTRMFVLTRTFGTTAEAERAGRRVRRIHESVTGTEPDGTVYRIDEPGLLKWVHCGEVASFVDVARRSRLPFSAAELDSFVDEQRRSAELIGLDPASAPASVAELDAYYEQIRPSLYACDEAIEALRLTFHPPVPPGNRAMKLALPRFNAFAFSTLPGWARRLYGRPGGPLTDVTAAVGLCAARLATSYDPLFRTAMHALQRAEGRR